MENNPTSKEIRCCICGVAVTKRKSVCIGKYVNGEPRRACRTHPEAQKKAAELRQTNENTKAYEERKKQERDEERQERFFPPTAPKCMLCEREGLDPKTWGIHMLVELENIKKQKDRAIKRPVQDILRIDIIQLNEEQYEEIEKWTRIRPLFRDIIKHARAVRLCYECQDRTGIHVPKPEIFLEAMSVLGAALESGMKKDIKEVEEAVQSAYEAQVVESN